jgi:hypothetical protein
MEEAIREINRRLDEIEKKLDEILSRLPYTTWVGTWDTTGGWTWEQQAQPLEIIYGNQPDP